jgi:hypothetical protein
MKIKNKKTGQIMEINPSEAAKYGVTPRTSVTTDTNAIEPTETRMPLQGLGDFAGNSAMPMTATALDLLKNIGPKPLVKTMSKSNPLLSGTIWGLASSLPEYLKTLTNDVPWTDINKFENVGNKYMGGYVAGAGGELLGMGGNKVLGNILDKVKFGGPKTMQEGIGTVTNEYGKDIGNALNKLPQGSIDVTDPVKNLLEYRSKLEGVEGIKSNAKALQKIDEIFAAIGKNANLTPSTEKSMGFVLDPKKAELIKNTFNADIFGEAGKEVLKRGAAGTAEKTAKKMTAAELSKLIKEALVKNGMGDVLPSYKAYETGSNMVRSLDRPFQSQFGQLPALIGALGFASGNPLMSVAGFGTQAASMPYTNILLKKLIGELSRYGQYPLKAGVSGLINMGE